MKMLAMLIGMIIMMSFNQVLKGSKKRMIRLKIFMAMVTMFYSVGFIIALENFMSTEKVYLWIDSLNGTVTELSAYALLVIFTMLCINLFSPLHSLEREVQRSGKNKLRRRKEIKKIY